jgi:drug/metabolite transporter (DMT)-like permease
MIAFAANSVLCRLALSDSNNDPISFTLIRLLSGAIILFWIFIKEKSPPIDSNKRSKFLAPAMLFIYALFFSLSYVKISAGIGALILFSSVQLTMILTSFFRGQRLTKNEMAGFTLAALGFLYLVLPGIHMPSFVSAILMCIAGIAWGFYSLIGQGNKNPYYSTSRNFVYTTPLIFALMFFYPI